jgi:glycosyltransferase involved in cell wall biosynthesis
LEREWPIPGLDIWYHAIRVLRNCDVVHMWVPFYLSHTLLAIMSFFSSTKLVLTMDTVPAYSFSMGSTMDALMKLYYKTFGRIVFAAADTITLYGESMKPYALQAGVPEEKIAITPTGIDDETKDVDIDVRDEFGIDGPMALFVGLIVPRKGIDLIIEIAKELPEHTFVLVGDSPKREQFERMASDVANVIFTGFRKDVHNFYHAADYLIFPSRGEGLAGVIMESMVYEVPIVTSRIPCTTDLITDGESGYLCEIEDVACYVDKIQRLDEDTKEQFTSNAKERIKEYSWEASIERFEKVYQKRT